MITKYVITFNLCMASNVLRICCQCSLYWNWYISADIKFADYPDVLGYLLFIITTVHLARKYVVKVSIYIFCPVHIVLAVHVNFTENLTQNRLGVIKVKIVSDIPKLTMWGESGVFLWARFLSGPPAYIWPSAVLWATASSKSRKCWTLCMLRPFSLSCHRAPLRQI